MSWSSHLLVSKSNLQTILKVARTWTEAKDHGKILTSSMPKPALTRSLPLENSQFGKTKNGRGMAHIPDRLIDRQARSQREGLSQDDILGPMDASGPFTRSKRRARTEAHLSQEAAVVRQELPTEGIPQHSEMLNNDQQHQAQNETRFTTERRAALSQLARDLGLSQRWTHQPPPGLQPALHGQTIE
jgi:hypothetical protein